ncbi:MAG: ribosome-associated translation inhibitor RaiA [Oscillospiraceae bacterium]|nr:ribosome-associated translation inhibitor RaiA [Oscillospiraceae bacterium]
MKFTFTEKKMAPSDSLRAYVEKKAGKIDRFFRTESEAFVTFSTERGRFLVELTIKNNGMFFRASELTSDMYASVDSAVATIERQIRKNKTRLAKKLREGAVEREVQELPYVAEEDFAEPEEFDVVRKKQFSIKPMSVEEAILQMNLLDHEFFVFRDEAADGAFSVVYRRKKGGYGLIADDAE